MNVTEPNSAHPDNVSVPQNGEPHKNEMPKEYKILNIPISEIRAFAKQPREFFDPTAIRELAESMRELGQVTPGLVRPIEPPEGEHKFELIDGERRIRACLMVPLKFFRAQIDTDITNDRQQFERSVAANFCRADHPPLEIARAIKRFKEEFGYSDKQVAARLGRGVGYVVQYYSLTKLHVDVQKLMDPALPEQNRLTVTIALRLASVPLELQLKLALEITGKRLKANKARYLIETTMHKAGVQDQARRPMRNFDILEGFLERSADQLKLFNEVPNASLLETLSSRGLQDRMRLTEQLETIMQQSDFLLKKMNAVLACRPDPSLH